MSTAEILQCNKWLWIFLFLVLPRTFLFSSCVPHSIQNNLNTIKYALILFLIDVGRYPTNEEGLRILVENYKNLPSWKGPYLETYKDAYKNEYRYIFPSKHNSGQDFDLYSVGINNIDDYGEKDDITMWKTINFEYYGEISETEKNLLYISTLSISTLFLILLLIFKKKNKFLSLLISGISFLFFILIFFTFYSTILMNDAFAERYFIITGSCFFTTFLFGIITLIIVLVKHKFSPLLIISIFFHFIPILLLILLVH